MADPAPLSPMFAPGLVGESPGHPVTAMTSPDWAIISNLLYSPMNRRSRTLCFRPDVCLLDQFEKDLLAPNLFQVQDDAARVGLQVNFEKLPRSTWA